MVDQLSVFTTPEGEAVVFGVYDAVLRRLSAP